MVGLDLESLNNNAPYRVEKYGKEGYYSIMTDFGVIYHIFFIQDFNLTSDEVYQFVIANANNKPSPRDTKLRDTILELLFEFFRLNNHSII